MDIKLEDPVSIKFTTLTGVVKGAAVDQTTLEMQVLVEYTDVDGEVQQRYFKASEVEIGQPA